MGANSISTTDPIVTAAARQLELTMIQRAWVAHGVLYIVTPFKTCEIPYPTGDLANTLPSRGPQQPAQLDDAEIASGETQPPTEDPAPPQGPGSSSPSPPREEGKGEGLDDFTAIDGVGPVTAQKLHDAGLYTYDDLREWPEALETLGLPAYQRNRIRRWLDQRLV